MQLPWGVFSFSLSYGSVLSIFSLFTTCAQFSLSCLFWRSSQIAKFQISPYRHTQSVFTFLWNLLSKTTLQHPRFRSLFPTVLLVRYAKEVLEELLQSVKRNIKFGALLMFLSQHRDWNKAKSSSPTILQPLLSIPWFECYQITVVTTGQFQNLFMAPQRVKISLLFNAVVSAALL